MTDQSFTARRRAMVESQLRTDDVNNPALIRAILAVARERHVPAAQQQVAYIDRPVPLSPGRSLNPPVATARLIDAARVEAGQKVLVVGAASGYSAAVIAELGAEVVALECDPALVALARGALGGSSAVTLVEGPLDAGVEASAPFDSIIVDGAVERLPDSLIAQIKVGGRAAFATLDRGVSRLCAGVRTAGGFGATPFVAARLPLGWSA
jgi:protein-L-isoaspartate(D-aspartate) O-methyltransferase